jgi:hypothetical protein
MRLEIIRRFVRTLDDSPGEVLIVGGMLSCVDTIVEHSYVAIWHHLVNEADVYILPPTVGIAKAGIDCFRCDLRLANATSMYTDLITECLRTSK